MIAYSAVGTEFKISPVLVWKVCIPMTFFVTYEALDGSARVYIVIPRESTSSSVTLASIIVPALISSVVVSLSVLIIWWIVLLVMLCHCICLVYGLIVLSVL